MTHVPTTPASQSKIHRADEAKSTHEDHGAALDTKGVLTDVESMPLLRGRWRFLGVEGRKVS